MLYVMAYALHKDVGSEGTENFAIILVNIDELFCNISFVQLFAHFYLYPSYDIMKISNNLFYLRTIIFL